MNQDRVKEILLETADTELEFSVVFTGKSSKKVNGLYKPDTHEIILHNKNFANDNELSKYLSCVAGTVTAFGLVYDKENKVNVIIDSAVDKDLTVGFHPFVNTSTLNIKFSDFE